MSVRSVLLTLCLVGVVASPAAAAQAATVSGSGVYNEGTVTAAFDVDGDALTASGSAEFVFDGSVIGSIHRETYRGEATCLEASVTRRGYQATIGGDLTFYENSSGLVGPAPAYFHVTVADNIRGDKIDRTSSWSLNDTPGCSREEPTFQLESGGILIAGAVGPETTIDSGPTGPTGPSPTFEFSADDPTAGVFQCRLDEAPFASCESPVEYSDLAPGPHIFRVKATDAAGNIDPTPALRKFIVE